MTRKQALAQARQLLAAKNIEDAPLEAELLLRHTLKINRAQLYTDLNYELNPEQEKTYRQIIWRRLEDEPSAYITGHCEFYGLDIYVNHSVLIPRPESELLVEKAIKIVQNEHLATIADIGTGCGAIAISLAMNLPEARIYATDISSAALEVARFNCQQHSVSNRIHLLPGDMLDPLPKPVDLIVANLPYVRESELDGTGVLSFEPELALNGGAEGLDKIFRLCYQLSNKLNKRGCLLLEIGQNQGKPVVDLLNNLLPAAQIEITQDFNALPRVVSLSLTPKVQNVTITTVLPEQAT
ncbi:peptide chain release factor N(5)-glutamine methyltransferase [Chloroflexota bacterium]